MWSFHKWFERHSLILLIGILVVVSIGGLVQITPLFFIESTIERVQGVRPYTPLELAGREIYIREGCYVCHSQMIRPLRDEVERYGHYSLAAESMYDHPFQWGSKRTGPDLQRLGGKYPDFWHFRHMLDPRSTSPGSIMPTYPWLYDTNLDTSLTVKKMQVMKQLGVPYTDQDIQNAVSTLEAQAKSVTDGLVQQGVPQTAGLERREIIPMIAYLQRLGKDIKQK